MQAKGVSIIKSEIADPFSRGDTIINNTFTFYSRSIGVPHFDLSQYRVKSVISGILFYHNIWFLIILNRL
jgi:hypothetical protein